MSKIQPKVTCHKSQENTMASQPTGANLNMLKLSDKANKGTTS